MCVVVVVVVAGGGGLVLLLMLLVAVGLIVPLKYRGKEVRLRVFFGGDMANLRPQSTVDIQQCT